MFDMNDAEPPRGSDLIPNGTFAKVTLRIRPGGSDGGAEADRGLLRASKSPGSDMLLLDCEFTVEGGPHARRKFWQMFTVAGGKVDAQGVSIGWKISKGFFRAMLDSAFGFDPSDVSEAARAKRLLRGLADLDGLTFAVKIRVEPSNNPSYADSNRLDRVVLPGEPEWRRIMDGEAATAPPGAGGVRGATAAPGVWEQPSAVGAARPPPRPAPEPASGPASAGPAWLNG